MPRELATGYHVTNFQRLLDSVYCQFSDLLLPEELALYHSFHNLSYPAQSLYVRLLCRTRDLFRMTQLNYPDIPSLEQSIEELQQARLINVNPSTALECLLPLFTKTELSKAFNLERASRQLTAPALRQLITEQFSENIFETLLANETILQPCFNLEFETYKVCFFGNSYQDLSEFVITELGHVTYESYPLTQATRYFSSRQQIDAQLSYADAHRLLASQECMSDKEQLVAIANQLPNPGDHQGLKRRYQRIITSIGRQLERLQAWADALLVYQLSDYHSSLERQVRVLKKTGALEQAWDLCRKMAASCEHPEALEFTYTMGYQLTRLLKRPAQVMGNAPLSVKSIEQSTLTLAPGTQSVEYLAASALNTPKQACFYVENHLFTSLLGLLFWDIIFSPIRGAFINPFQRAPLDIHSSDFYQQRQLAIESRLETLKSEDWKPIINRHFAEKAGIANPYVHWGLITKPLLTLSCEKIPANHLTIIFRQILSFPKLFRSGLPDLIYFHETGYQLVEVKGPGDRLQSNQARWFKVFQDNSIPASLLWVEWQQDTE